MAAFYDPRVRGPVPLRGTGGPGPYYPGARPAIDGGTGYDDMLTMREREMEEARRAMWRDALLREEAARRLQTAPRLPAPPLNPEQGGPQPTAPFQSPPRREIPSQILFNDQIPPDPYSGLQRLSDEKKADIGANAPHMTPKQMQEWFYDHGMSITPENAQAVRQYYVDGGKQNAVVSDAKLEEAYRDKLDAQNARLDQLVGPADQEDLFQNGFVAGSRPFLMGLGGGLGSIAGGNEWSEGYTLAADAERRRLAQARERLGLWGTVAEGAGMVGGSVALGLGTGALVTRAPMIAGYMSPGMGMAVGDTVFGAIHGANNAAPGNTLGGAATGAMTGLTGNLAGTGAGKVTGSAISPTGGSAAPLYDQGVRLSIGQRFSGGSGLKGLAGNVVGEAERLLERVPFLGHAVRDTRDRAIEDFERGAFNKSLALINDRLPDQARLGATAQSYAQGAFDAAYARARSGLIVRADHRMTEQTELLQRAITDGRLDEAAAKRFKKIVRKNVKNHMRNGVLDGNSFSAAASEIGRIARESRDRDSGLANALQTYLDILDDSARRYSPAEAVAKLDAADTGYAQFERINAAFAQRAKTRDEYRNFTPEDLVETINKPQEPNRSEAWLRGETQMSDYAAAGKEKLGFKRGIDDNASSIANAQALVGFAGGGALASGLTTLDTLLGAGATIAAPYMPGIRDIVHLAMAPRKSPRARAVADAVRRNAYFGGGILSPLSLPYLTQQQWPAGIDPSAYFPTRRIDEAER